MEQDWNTPIFTTGIAAGIVGVTAKTLINYDVWGLFSPQRTNSGRRLYSREDLYEILVIKYLFEQHHLTANAVKLVFELLEEALSRGVDLRDKILPPEVQSKFEAQIP